MRAMVARHCHAWRMGKGGVSWQLLASAGQHLLASYSLTSVPLFITAPLAD